MVTHTNFLPAEVTNTLREKQNKEMLSHHSVSAVNIVLCITEHLIVDEDKIYTIDIGLVVRYFTILKRQF